MNATTQYLHRGKWTPAWMVEADIRRMGREIERVAMTQRQRDAAKLAQRQPELFAARPAMLEDLYRVAVDVGAFA